MKTHEIAVRSGNIQRVETAETDMGKVSRERLNAREALWLHVLMNHLEIAGASFVG